MNKLKMVTLVGMLAVSVSAPARAEEAVLNNPPAGVSLAKQVIAKLDPSYETLWDWADGTFSQGVSASLYTVTSQQIPVVSLRVGTGTNEVLYAGAGLDLPGLTKRFVPAVVKGYATAAPLDLLWSLAGKYARITPVAGYSWGDRHAVYGVTVGAAINF